MFDDSTSQLVEPPFGDKDGKSLARVERGAGDGASSTCASTPSMGSTASTRGSASTVLRAPAGGDLRALS